ncbi:IS66 family transposase [Dictyobacter vulcani]|nr:IS66 family transposase [Dictyobacter vulcani]
MREEDVRELQSAFRELKIAYSELQEKVKQQDQHIEELRGQLLKERLRNLELEKRLAKDSRNSSKPPSSDGYKRQQKRREKSQKKSGGQKGHSGHQLAQVETPDEVIEHRARDCQHCQHPLSQTVGVLKERRQVHELPPLRLQVREHQQIEQICPRCGGRSCGNFPPGVDAAAQYGPNVRGLAVYLSQFQLLPLERITELFADLHLGTVSEGSIVNWVREAAKNLSLTQQALERLVLQSRLAHVDETGGRIEGILHWFHVVSTRALTIYHWHRKRGHEAMNEMGLLPLYTGRLVHDRWKSYDQYRCEHSLCGAHLLRDCLFVAEEEKQPWAQEMYIVLLELSEATKQARACGQKTLDPAIRTRWLAAYFEVIGRGYRAWDEAHPPPEPTAARKRGRPKQDPGKNLLDAFLHRADQVLAFVDDLTVPFTNNLAERDLRMIKVQQKISGTFRSDAGATAFCTIRSYLSTMRKQGHSMLDALAAVFQGSPLPIAWEAGS